MIEEQKDDGHSVQPLLQQCPVGCSLSSAPGEEFDKLFEDFKRSISSQMEKFGEENNCRVIILNHEVVAVINLRPQK